MLLYGKAETNSKADFARDISEPIKTTFPFIHVMKTGGEISRGNISLRCETQQGTTLDWSATCQNLLFLEMLNQKDSVSLTQSS